MNEVQQYSEESKVDNKAAPEIHWCEFLSLLVLVPLSSPAKQIKDKVELNIIAYLVMIIGLHSNPCSFYKPPPNSEEY